MHLTVTFGLSLIIVISTWPLCSDCGIGIGQEYMSKVTQSGLDYVRAIGIPFLVQELNSLTIPNVSGTTDTPLGKITFALTRISLSSVGIPKSNLTINQKKGLTISADNAALTVQANWKYRQEGWPHISDSGTTELKLKRIHLEVTLKVDVKNESNPMMKISNCRVNVGTLKLKFHGGASWLYNAFADPIAVHLKGTMEKEVCHSIISAVDKEGNKFMAKLPNIIKNIERHLQEQQKDEIEDNEF